MILDSVLEQVGRTPMVRADRLASKYGIKCNLLLKCEYFNAGASVKDRIAQRMIAEAEADGRLIRGKSTIIEPTSGNTGIGLALHAAVLGYRCIICLPEKMSKEKVTALQALGAEVIRTPTEAEYEDPASHYQVAARLAREIPYGIVLNQYNNACNPDAHYYGTAVEIIDDIRSISSTSAAGTTGNAINGADHANGTKGDEADSDLVGMLSRAVRRASITDGLPGPRAPNGAPSETCKSRSSNGVHHDTNPRLQSARTAASYSSSGVVDLFVAGAGTGGTISGISKRLKEEYPGSALTLGVDPVGSMLAQPEGLNILKEGETEVYAVEGIGYDFVPEVLDRSLVDRWVKINDDDSFSMTRELIRTEGLLVGGSSGCIARGAIRFLTETEEGKKLAEREDANVVIMMPDSIRNYITKPWLLGAAPGEAEKVAA